MLVSTLLHSWKQNWQQILFVFLGMVSGVAGLSAVLIINETAKQKINGLNDTLLSDIYAIARLEPDKTFNKSQYAELRKSGVELVAGARFQRTINNETINFLALDSAAMLTVAALRRTTSQHSDSDTLRIFDSNQQSQINLFQPQTSKSYYQNVISTLNVEDFAPFPLPIISQLVKEDIVYMSFSQASVMPEALNLNELWIISEPKPADIKYLEAAGFNIQFIEYQQSNITSSFHINIFAMGGLMLVVSFFVVLNAYNLLISGRLTFVKQLYVLGVSLNKLRVLFLLEAWFLAIVCIFLGFYLGELLSGMLAPGVRQTLEGLYDVNFGAQKPGILALKLQIALVTISAITLTIIFPLNQMLKSLASDITRQYDDTHSGTRRSPLLLVCLMVLLIVVIELIFKQSLLMSFVTIILIVSGGCFGCIYVLPKLLNYVKTKIPEEKPIAFYFASDAARLSQRNSIAFCAFFIAITANIGMNLMVDSFRSATQTWLDKQFVADFYLGTDSPKPIRQWQQKQSDLFIYEREKANILFRGQRTELIAVPESGFEFLNLKFKTYDHGSTAEATKSVFINEQLSLRTNLAPGDTITISHQKLMIKGIYYDYGNMQNQIIVDAALVRSLQKKPPIRHLFSVTQINKDSTGNTLQEFTHFLKANEISWFTGENIRKISVNIFDQTFVITSVLNIVTLLVAGISLATSIIIVAKQNKHHYAVLRQMGVKHREIRRANFIQYWYIVTLLFLCAIPFGVLLSWLLIYKINYLSFYWTYPMVLNFTPILLVYVLAITTISLCLLFSFTLKPYENRIASEGVFE